MKFRLFILSLFVFPSLLLTQSRYDTYSGFTVSTTPVLPASERHPSLFFDTSAIAAVKNRASQSSYGATLWSRCSTNIAKYRIKTASATDENERPKMAMYCAFAWLMNNDTQARQKAIDALMIAYDGVPQTAAAAMFDKPYDEIYRGTWLQNYCQAYDWIASQLTPAQNDTIRTRIAREAQLLRDNMVTGVRYAPRPHNHRSKPAYGLATAALALSSHAQAADWLQFALTQLNTVTKYQFSADGIYREGGHYNVYAAINAIPFLWQYRNVSGVDLFPAYAPMFENAVRVRTTQGFLPLFEDSFVKPFPMHIGAAAYTTTSTQLHPTASLGSVLQWSYFHTNIFDPDYTGATTDLCWDLTEYLLYDSTIPMVQPTATATQALAWGEVAFRRSWNYDDPSNRCLLFHGVADADNHNHPDKMSFMIEAENSIMATDCGYGPDGSSDDRRTTWYTVPEANNTVTVDNTALYDDSSNTMPATTHCLLGGDMEVVEKEGVFGNGAVWDRAITFPHKSYWVLRDRVRSSASRTTRWYLHGRGTLAITGSNARWTTPGDEFGSSALFDTWTGNSAGVSLQPHSGWLSLFWGYEETAPYCSVQIQDTVAMILSVLYPRGAGSTAPAVTQYGSGYELGMRVVFGDTIDYHTANKDAALRQIGAVTTDGEYSFVSQKARSTIGAALTAGSLVQLNGATLLSTTKTTSLVCWYAGAGAVTVTADTAAAPYSITLHLPFAASSAGAVTINGQTASFTVLADSTIRLAVGMAAPIASAQSGSWSVAATWTGGVVPESGTDVVIASGHVVTIDISGAECGSVQINGTLQFRADGTAAGLSIHGDAAIQSGGALKVITRSPAGAANSYCAHTLNLYGNLTNAGTLDLRAGSNGAGTANGAEVSFLGGSSSVVSLSLTSHYNGQEEFNSVTINKTGGASVVLSSGCVFMSNNSSTGPSVLTFVSGRIVTGDNKWVVLSTSQGGVIGGAEGRYVQGWLGRGLSTSAATTRWFEIGNSDLYRRVWLETTAAIASGGYIAVRMVDGDANNGSALVNGILAVSHNSYYEIQFNKGTSATTQAVIDRFALSYGAADGVLAGNTDLRLAYSTDGRATWYGIGPVNEMTVFASPADTLTSNVIAPAVTLTDGQMVRCALAGGTEGLNPLPVQLTSFTLSCHRDDVAVRWETAGMVDCYRFDVERRSAGTTAWTMIGSVDAAGTEAAPRTYEFYDAHAPAGRQYYRIRCLYRDGSSEYANEQEITAGLAPRTLSLAGFPNPFNPAARIEFTVAVDGPAAVHIYDAAGRLVAEPFSGAAEAGRYYGVRFDGASFSSGVYFVRLQSGRETRMCKLVLMK